MTRLRVVPAGARPISHRVNALRHPPEFAWLNIRQRLRKLAWQSQREGRVARQVDGRCGPVLVVDDDDGLCAFVVDVLQDAGYLTSSTNTGRGVFELVRRDRVALVILDVQLPELSGYEVCRRLREEGPCPPILFISGERTEPLDRVAGLLLGADDYLVKPFAPDELVARVRNLLLRGQNGRDVANLTRREVSVLELLAEGLGHNEIARRLVISPKTVGTHVAHIYEKLGAHNRTQALSEAYRRRVLAAP
jgi:DNA-binding NarL/FixJ family response regulator